MVSSQLKTIRVTVATAGVRVKVSSTPIYTTDFQFQPAVGNTGTYMYIGASDVSSSSISFAKGSVTAFSVGRGDPVTDDTFDLSKWYVDADTSGDIGIIQYRVLED